MRRDKEIPKYNYIVVKGDNMLQKENNATAVAIVEDEEREYQIDEESQVDRDETTEPVDEATEGVVDEE